MTTNCPTLGYENDNFANEIVLGFVHKITQSNEV
jgi:hypothetical protein